ncbi:MAG: permease [Planctomycetes bacterium]|nr:permease [Planctomycetota bacterium]
MTYLLASLALLALGPFLAHLARRLRGTALVLDAFALVVLGGLVLLHILPHALLAGGLPALLAGTGAFWLTGAAERSLHTRRGGAANRFSRLAVPLLALLGLGFHAIVDGLALAGVDVVHDHATDHAHDHDGAPLLWAVAVLAHRLPVATSLWWIVAPLLGLRAAVTVVAVLAAGTLIGFVGGEPLLGSASPATIALFEAILSGTLLHVVLHADLPAAPRGASRLERSVATLLGLAAGLTVVRLVEGGHAHGTAAGAGPTSGEIFVDLALDSAPALLVAYVGIGLLQTFLPPDLLRRATRGSPLGQALRGMAIGIPMPVCSCGVVPLYRDLVRRGSSPIAGLAFLVATPELELAAILLTLQLLGPELAIARVVSAAAVAVLASLAVARFARPAPHGAGRAPERAANDPAPAGARWRAALRHGFVEAVDETAPWLLVGLGAAALLTPHLDPAWLGSLPSAVAVPLAAAIGLPLYVCASGSTPLAAALIAGGLSPGAAIAFLLTGPATNVTTFGVLRDLHGRRTAVVFAIGVFVAATAFGLLSDVALAALDPDWTAPRPAFAHAHEHGPTAPLRSVALGIVALLFLASLLRRGPRRFLGGLFETPNMAAIRADAGGHGGDRRDRGHRHGHSTAGHAHSHDHSAPGARNDGCHPDASC